MKILFSQVFYGIGGSENYLLKLLPALHATGVECIYLNLFSINKRKESEKYSEKFENIGIKVIHIPFKSFLSFSLYRHLNRIFLKENINAVHSHLIHSDLLWSICKVFFNKKLILFSTKHGYQHDRYARYALCPEKLVKDHQYYINKFIEKNVNKSYACSFSLRNFYEKSRIVEVGRMDVIHHGFDYPDVSNVIPKKIAKYQICIVGRLNKWKGQHLMLQILPNIITKYPELKVLFLGTGPYQDNLQKIVAEKKLSNNVVFLGFVSNVMEYTSAADINILPSLVESMPLVILEYYNVKKPLITFDILGCGEIVENENTGLLIPPFNADILKEKILYILENPHQGDLLAIRGYKKLKSEFPLSKMVTNTVKFYEKNLNL